MTRQMEERKMGKDIIDKKLDNLNEQERSKQQYVRQKLREYGAQKNNLNLLQEHNTVHVHEHQKVKAVRNLH